MDDIYFFIPKSKLNKYGLTFDSTENDIAFAISGEDGALCAIDDLFPHFEYVEEPSYNFPIFKAEDDFGIVVTWDVGAGIVSDIYNGNFKTFPGHIKKVNDVLFRAAENGDVEEAKLALDNGAQIDNRDKNAGWTPLQRAASYGHFEMVKFLTESGADIHKGYDFAFRRAVSNGHFDIVKYLYDNGADIHFGNEEALHTAVGHGKKEIAQFLIEKGAVVWSDKVQSQYEKIASDTKSEMTLKEAIASLNKTSSLELKG